MFKGFLITISAVMLLQGCASPKVSVSMLMPAKYSEPAKYKRVAILAFKGRDGRGMAEKLEARLVSMRYKDQPWFDIYERDQLNAALKELRLGSSGLVDFKTAAKIGQFIGVRGIYMGSVNTVDVDSRSYSEKRSYCVEKQNNKCVRWADKSVSCREKRAVFEFTPKLVDVETSRVVYSRSITKTHKVSSCSDSHRSIMSDDELIGVLKTEALIELVEDVAPYVQYRKLVIKISSKGLDGEASNYFESGNNFAKENRLNRGCELWEKARQSGGKSVGLFYNLGICEESHGNIEGAEEWYYQADQMLMKPDKDVSSALERMRIKRDAKRKLHSQLL